MEEENLFSIFISILFIALVACVINACREVYKQDEYYFRKYPECATAGKPRVCVEYKRMLEEQ